MYDDRTMKICKEHNELFSWSGGQHKKGVFSCPKCLLYRCTHCGFECRIKPEWNKGECPKAEQHYYVEIR